MILSPILLSQALLFKTPNGDIYRTVDHIPTGACVLTGKEQMIYDIQNINTCNSITLEPGCYRAELRGGIGTANENCLDFAAQDKTPITSAMFSLSEQTTIYALRGGDGNPGHAVINGNYIGSIGGGASGVDSILVVGNRVWRAPGGAGKTCSKTTKTTGLTYANMDEAGTCLGNGTSGNSNLEQNISQSRTFHIDSSISTNLYAIGGGGGGAPSDTGGTHWYRQATVFNDDVIIAGGTDGTVDGGGNGGNVVSCQITTCTTMQTATGGAGGKNTYYSCGGQNAISYGGGGGGGTINHFAPISNGGDGGSGSTGTSDISFIRIYKM